MPIILPRDIPAYDILQKENIFIMPEVRAATQDIRPIEIAVLNLMPNKEVTETQLIRLLGNTPLQVNLTLLNTATHESKNVSRGHLQRFYRNFSDVATRRFDGMIVTGAPVETLPFEEVKYWNELKEILEYASEYVTTTMYICWGAQAGLCYHYGIPKYALKEKLFGVYPHYKNVPFEPLLKGLDDEFWIPQSRHTYVKTEDIAACPDLEILASGEKTGAAIMKSRDGKRFFFTGHAEYDRDTLQKEYLRDREKGLDIPPPENYYDEKGGIRMRWCSTANLLFFNWLNYYVYQVTPYRLG